MIKGKHLLVLLALLYVSTVFAQKQYNTSITLSTDKSEFILYENIFLNIKIENFDDPGPKISGFGDIYEYLKVIKLEDNTIVKPNSISEMYYGQSGMAKGKIFKGLIDMNDGFGKLVNPAVLYYCLPIGSYKVYCEYQDPSMYDYKPIISNEIIFYVREGAGKEKEVQELFEKCLINIQELNFSALDTNTEILANN